MQTPYVMTSIIKTGGIAGRPSPSYLGCVMSNVVAVAAAAAVVSLVVLGSHDVEYFCI